MWFNSMIREKPYQGLTDDTRETLPGLDIYWNVAEMQQLLAAGIQVLHGCRQLVL